ncbi:hypothetical protein NC652_031639 [Populus alba x Populus x berolinensis]|nr:hypothetical protein NC652_031639 [Populus alba x Populus x berolinensis]
MRVRCVLRLPTRSRKEKGKKRVRERQRRCLGNG